jgi:mono/diheme cytochrome c family protein
MDNSVRRHAAGIETPNLAAAETIRTGAMIYEKSCVFCHGAPGIDRSDIGNGLNPLPPKLEKAAPDWTPAELFWIAKNGIKMSGMPAFGRSLSDSQLWAVVALLKQYPDLTPEQYRALNDRRK